VSHVGKNPGTGYPPSPEHIVAAPMVLPFCQGNYWNQSKDRTAYFYNYVHVNATLNINRGPILETAPPILPTVEAHELNASQWLRNTGLEGNEGENAAEECATARERYGGGRAIFPRPQYNCLHSWSCAGGRGGSSVDSPSWLRPFAMFLSP
jgi:hypothetical protein